MTGYTWEEIARWVIGVVILIIGIVLLFHQLFPVASGMFWGQINNATGIFKIGKEKLDYEFEMPPHMEDNVEIINKTILTLSKSEEIIEQSLKLEAFKKSELTVRQDYKGKLKMMLKNPEGQIEFYKTKISYSPCIVDIETKGFEDYIRKGLDYRIKYAAEHIKFVERINFKNEKTFKVDKKKESDEIYEGDYVFLEEYAFIKIDKDICFVGYRTS